jgi:alpha-beta hydrolase superfamily lysophospholipase
MGVSKRTQVPAMQQVATEDVYFYSGPGLKLAGRVYHPDEKVRNGAGVVFCYGFGGLKEGTPVGLSTILAQAGYTVLAFDYRGFGTSEGKRALLNPADQVEDAVHALEKLASLPSVDPDQIGIYGTSFGGGVAAIAAYRSGRAKALAMSVPVVSGSDWLKNVGRWWEFGQLMDRARTAITNKVVTGEIELGERLDIMLPDPQSLVRYADKVPLAIETAYHVYHHEPIDIAHRLTMPVLLFGAKDDTLVPYEQTERFFEAVTAPKRLNPFEVGNHWVVYDEGLEATASATIDWFDIHVRGLDRAPATWKGARS